MKTIKKVAAKIDKILERNLISYIDKVTKTLYPKPHLYDSEDDEDDDPILFI